jgi:hypothetical protein
MVIVGGYEAYKTVNYYKKNNIGVKKVHEMPEHADDDVDFTVQNG